MMVLYLVVVLNAQKHRIIILYYDYDYYLLYLNNVAHTNFKFNKVILKKTSSVLALTIYFGSVCTLR